MTQNQSTSPAKPIRLRQNEPWRPQYHFSPPRQWLNDPNGLVYYSGEYHLFYQYHPHSTVWGPMHWGHAVSPDLVNWTHLPIALYPDEHGQIYSGSVVVDRHNSAGFGAGAFVALFTHHNPIHARQSQSVAYSVDHGRSWHKYAGNPIIPPPEGLVDFRDPKVLWYENGQEDGYWVMVLAAGEMILFYQSDDLRQWRACGRFGVGHNVVTGVWETPDLFPLPTPAGETCWVLLVSVGQGAPAGGSGISYFLGHFDGHTFHTVQAPDAPLWGDYGADAYAAQTWSDAPEGRRLAIAWMSNWDYATTTPSAGWRGGMTLPRALRLKETVAGLRLCQLPVPELTQLRQTVERWTNILLAAGETFPLSPATTLLELQLSVNLSGTGRLDLCCHYGERATVTVSFDPMREQVTFDRGRAGPRFHDAYTPRHDAPLRHDGAPVTLSLFVDHAALELFVNQGEVVMSEQIFPAGRLSGISLSAHDGPVHVSEVSLFPLRAAHFHQATR